MHKTLRNMCKFGQKYMCKFCKCSEFPFVEKIYAVKKITQPPVLTNVMSAEIQKVWWRIFNYSLSCTAALIVFFAVDVKRRELLMWIHQGVVLTIIGATLASAFPPLVGWWVSNGFFLCKMLLQIENDLILFSRNSYVPETSGMSCAPNWEVFCPIKAPKSLFSSFLEQWRFLLHPLSVYNWLLHSSQV